MTFRSEPVQMLRRLVSRRTERWERGRFVVEGPKLLAEALASGAGVETVFVETGTASEDQRALSAQAAAAGADVVEVEAGMLARVCDAVTPQPIAAVVAMVHRPLAAIEPSGLWVVGIGLADPGNAGAVIRSAAASGSAAVVFCAGAVDIYNPKTVRASAGSLFHVPVVAGPGAEAVLEELGRAGLRRVATVARGGVGHDRVDWTEPAALVLGSESHGLPSGLGALLDEQVTVPMAGPTESLNVAMAATVVCFEAARQRRALEAGAPRRPPEQGRQRQAEPGTAVWPC